LCSSMKKFYLIISAFVTVISGCGPSSQAEPKTFDLPWFPSMEASPGKASYVLNDGDLVAAKAYYDLEMAGSGWKASSDSKGKNGEVDWTMTEWKKAGSIIRINYLDHPDKDSKDYILFEDTNGHVLEIRKK